MHLYYDNVNQAFYGLVVQFHHNNIEILEESSRNGPVLRCVEPVTITYARPWERVLFNKARDCNPFFHMFEALWMLAGRNDLKPLVYYNPRMGDYSDDGKTLNGAYGYRWRRAQGDIHPDAVSIVDQLEILAERLREYPYDRRCVLQMWNIEDDLLKIGTSKDVCCNTHVYFSARRQELSKKQDPRDWPDGRPFTPQLDMTVCNRSNDLVWGMLGANYVHFTFLQEYMAACLGWEVGVYNHFTNNLHVYKHNWEPDKWLAKSEEIDPYDTPLLKNCLGSSRIKLVQEPARFDDECNRFVESIDGEFKEPFLGYVAQPMMAAFRQHKKRNYRGDNNALVLIERVHATDWKIVGKAWLERRRDKWEAKSKVQNAQNS